MTIVLYDRADENLPAYLHTLAIQSFNGKMY